MRHLLAWLTGFGILASAVLLWGPPHGAPPRTAAPAPAIGPPPGAGGSPAAGPSRTGAASPTGAASRTAAAPRGRAADAGAAPSPPAGAAPQGQNTGSGHAPAPARRAGRTEPAAPRRPAPLPPIGARALLQRALGALKSPPAFHGTLAERVSHALPAVDRAVGRDGGLLAPGSRLLSIWHDRPDLWRIAARAAAGAPADRLTVADGATVTTWSRRGGSLSRVPQRPGADGPPGLGGLDGLLAGMKQGAQLRVAGQGTVDGRAAYRLHALQRVGGLAADAVALWIDGRTYLPLRIDATGPAGIPLVSAGFTRIAFAASPAARFLFAPPAGAARTGH